MGAEPAVFTNSHAPSHAEMPRHRWRDLGKAEHDLESSDVGNIQGVSAAVSGLCSSDPSAELDAATDWDADTW